MPLKLFRLIWKSPFVILCILLFFLLGIINKILFYPFPTFRKNLAQRNTLCATWICRKIIGYRGIYRLNKIPQGHLIICNHMSYMDILVIASKVPTLFVTSLDMKHTPFLGWITQIGECLYVNRKSHKNINQEIKIIQTWINKGFNVLIFPEATTSDGTRPKQFKSSLLQISQNGDIPITAYCLKYTHLNHQKTSKEDMIQNIAWFEKAGFLPHVLKQLMNANVTFELLEVDSFRSTEFIDRKPLVLRLEKKITEEYLKTVPL